MSTCSHIADPRALETRLNLRAYWPQVVLLALSITSLYYRIVINLVAQWWRDPNYSHGFIVPIFCVWVVWKNRARLLSHPPTPNWQGIFSVAGGLGLLVVGVLGAEDFLSRCSLLFVIAGLIIYFLGWKFFRLVLFPWACLFLTIPIPVIIFNEAALPLQFQASQLASVLLKFMGVPVLREGNVIQLPALTLDVVEACSGLRSLVSLITLAVMYGYVFERKIACRIFLIICSIPIAVLANGLRITGSGILGEYWSPEKAQGFFHLFSGLLIFLASSGMLFLLHAITSFLLQRRLVARHS